MDTDAYQELEAYLETCKKTYKETPTEPRSSPTSKPAVAELILSAQGRTVWSRSP